MDNEIKIPESIEPKEKSKLRYFVGLLCAAAIFSYVKRDQLSQTIANSDIYSKTPIKIEMGVPYYDKDGLGDLINTHTPVKLTNNTIDGGMHWSNDPRYVRNPLERIEGRLNPTHIIEFTETGKDVYRFDVRPTK